MSEKFRSKKTCQRETPHEAKPHPSGRFLVAGKAQPLWNPRQVVVVRRAKEDPPGRDDQSSRFPQIFRQFVRVFD